MGANYARIEEEGAVLLMDEHEACREEMRRIHNEWADKFYHFSRVKQVLITEGDHHGTWQRVGNIDRIIHEPDGITVFIK